MSACNLISWWRHTQNVETNNFLIVFAAAAAPPHKQIYILNFKHVSNNLCIAFASIPPPPSRGINVFHSIRTQKRRRHQIIQIVFKGAFLPNRVNSLVQRDIKIKMRLIYVRSRTLKKIIYFLP